MFTKYLDYIKENIQNEISKSIKINIKGDNKNLIDNLIEKLSFNIKKRKIKNIRIKEINGHINKEYFFNKNYFYKTNMEIININNDIIIGKYDSRTNNIKIEINGDLVYDMDSKYNDNEILIDKISNEYIKYLKNKGFKTIK
jgi:hypothetical protein